VIEWNDDNHHRLMALLYATPPIEPPANVAHAWRAWCGDTPWTRALEEFGRLGGLIQDWGGMPRSASAIPLTFARFDADGNELPCNYRLKDIRAAIESLRARGSS